MVLALAFLQSSNGMGFLNGIGSVLVTAAPFVGLACLAAAGVALRGEGGANFSVGGGFARWIVWAFIFCALPTIPLIVSALTNNSVGNLTANFSGGTSEFTSLGGGIQNFVQTWIVSKAVPAIAGFLVVKAILDSNEGESPFPSLITSIFLLSTTGIWTMAKSWVGSDEYGVATGMSGALTYLLVTVCPICGSFCFIGAVVQFIKGGRFGKLVISGLAMLSATGIWALVQSWG
jgi:hypothetical protein